MLSFKALKFQGQVSGFWGVLSVSTGKGSRLEKDKGRHGLGFGVWKRELLQDHHSVCLDWFLMYLHWD